MPDLMFRVGFDIVPFPTTTDNYSQFFKCFRGFYGLTMTSINIKLRCLWVNTVLK